MTHSVPTQPNEASGQGRRLQMWRPAGFGPNSALNGASTITARARHAVRNDAWAGTAIERSVSNGVGCGIQAKPAWGTPEQKDQQKQLWAKWLRVSDADGALDFNGQQALAWREWREAGEVFCRLRSRREEDGLPVPLQLQLIESEQCPRDYNATASNGNLIRNGIELNRIGRRVAYWMYRAHPGDDMGLWQSAELVRVPAEEVIHLYRPMRAGQLRGVSDLSPVLVELFNHKNLRDATLERVKLSNLFAGWYVREKGADPDPLVKDMATGVDEDATPLAGLEPGTMQELPEGLKPEFSDPPEPGTSYAEFIRGGLQAIAARLGIPYEILTGDLRDISDRALRLILNEFRRLIEMDQWLYMIPQLCQRVRDAWFDAAVLGGTLPIPGYGDIRDDVIKTVWVPQGWPYSHPVQDVDADSKAVRNGFTSRTKVVMTNGEDAEEIDAEQVEDNRRADEAGLAYDSDGRQTVREGAQDKPAPTSDASNDEDKT